MQSRINLMHTSRYSLIIMLSVTILFVILAACDSEKKPAPEPSPAPGSQNQERVQNIDFQGESADIIEHQTVNVQRVSPPPVYPSRPTPTKIANVTDEYPNPTVTLAGTESSDQVDRDVLVTLFHATDGADWTMNENWLSNRPLHDWYGVKADGHGQVTELQLALNNLTGAFPAAVGDLASLESLDFSQNFLTGPLPPELGNLEELESLYLHDNYLTGAIPPTLGTMESLRDLDLQNNQLSGPIPLELGELHRLESLYLGLNQLSGSIPPELGALHQLEVLELQINQLEGHLPQGMAALNGLSRLEFNFNPGLCAPADPAFQEWLKTLPEADGPNCEASAIPVPTPAPSVVVRVVIEREAPAVPTPTPSIPIVIGAETDREALIAIYHATNGSDWKVNYNWLTEEPLNNWAGVSVGDKGRVVSLVLYGNELSGPIPPEVGNLTKLEELYLPDNELTGFIPPELGNLADL